MTTQSWIRNLFARRVTCPIRKKPFRAQLALEALEYRWVPSKLTFPPAPPTLIQATTANVSTADPTWTVSNTLDDGSVGSLRWAVGQEIGRASCRKRV